MEAPVRKKKTLGYQYCSFVSFGEIMSVMQFTWKSGWLKTGAGTNMGPQSNMYLSAHDEYVQNSPSDRIQKVLHFRSSFEPSSGRQKLAVFKAD